MSKKQIRIGIIGFPDAGKTTYATKLQRIIEEQGETAELFHADNYLGRYPYTEVPHFILKDMAASSADYIIVEGIGVSRLLKRGWTPDQLVYVEGPESIGPGMSGLCTQVKNAMKDYKGKVRIFDPRSGT